MTIRIPLILCLATYSNKTKEESEKRMLEGVYLLYPIRLERKRTLPHIMLQYSTEQEIGS